MKDFQNSIWKEKGWYYPLKSLLSALKAVDAYMYVITLLFYMLQWTEKGKDCWYYVIWLNNTIASYHLHK